MAQGFISAPAPPKKTRRGVPRGYSQERKPATEVTPPRGRAPGRRVASPVGSPRREQRKTRLYGAASDAGVYARRGCVQDRLKANENRDTAMHTSACQRPRATNLREARRNREIARSLINVVQSQFRETTRAKSLSEKVRLAETMAVDRAVIHA